MSAMPLPTSEASSAANKRDIYIVVGLIALVLFGLIGMAAATGWQETLAQLQKITPLQICALLALSLINYLFRSLRWHLFALKLGLALPLRVSLAHFIGGFAMTITPGRVGELIRLRWIHKLSGRSYTSLLPLPLADRLYDLAAMGAVLGVASLAARAEAPASALVVAVLAMAVAFAATRPRLISGLVTGLWKALGRFPRNFAKARKAARSIAVFSAPGLAVPALVLAVIGWSAEGLALYLLLGWMGAEISLAAAIMVFLFSTLAGGLTGAPGGVGGAEAAMLVLLTAQGVPIETALPATAISRITTMWFAILLGFLTLPVAERISQGPNQT